MFRFENTKKVRRTDKFDYFQGKQTPFNNYTWEEDGQRFPRSVVKVSNDKDRHATTNGKQRRHPTQKPIELVEFLIKAYTNEGDIVLDPFSGSGTTAIACQRLNRQFLAIEKEREFYEYSVERLNKDVYQAELPALQN